MINIFKVVADKDIRKMSNIVENQIRRYVDSRIEGNKIFLIIELKTNFCLNKTL